MADVRDILDLETPAAPEVTKEAILGSDKKARRRPENTRTSKRPEGMNREVYALIRQDNNVVPPLFPTDTGKGYSKIKAKLGMKKVRAWEWIAFTNPARTDGATFHHWRRVADAGKEYPFAVFNKKVPIPTYTHTEYVQHLVTSGWTEAETDHLFDLCKRFDLRFIIIHDRWDKKFTPRSVEDLKNRYYQVCATLNKVKNQHEKIYNYDYEHEKKRKEQLKKLFERTQKQVEEEQTLLIELRKIEQRKKERDRKTQDLQKLITAADNQTETKKNDRKSSKKTNTTSRQKVNRSDSTNTGKLHVAEPTGIKFPDVKNSGVSLRSQRIKLPSSLGQKKMKGIEQTLVELNIDSNPPPTEQICQQFNELRSDIVLHYELKQALNTCNFELQSLRHQYEAMLPGQTLTIPPSLLPDQSANKTDAAGSTTGAANA